VCVCVFYSKIALAPELNQIKDLNLVPIMKVAPKPSIYNLEVVRNFPRPGINFRVVEFLESWSIWNSGKHMVGGPPVGAPSPRCRRPLVGRALAPCTSWRRVATLAHLVLRYTAGRFAEGSLSCFRHPLPFSCGVRRARSRSSSRPSNPLSPVRHWPSPRGYYALASFRISLTPYQFSSTALLTGVRSSTALLSRQILTEVKKEILQTSLSKPYYVISEHCISMPSCQSIHFFNEVSMPLPFLILVLHLPTIH
jgi:hypothetical protein